MTAGDGPLTVGALAKRTGLTVRTLHHYDRIGLLSPGGRSPAGYRLYGSAEIERLHRIVSLRHLGLSLDEIREHLDGEDAPALETIRRQLERLERQMDAARALRERLLRVEAALAARRPVEDDEFLDIIKEVVEMEKYYTPEQLEQLRKRQAEVGEDRIQAVQKEWADLFAALGAAMERGDDPADPAVQALATKARGLVAEFTGGDPEIAASLGRMYRQEGQRPLQQHGMGMSPELWEYYGKVMAVAGS